MALAIASPSPKTLYAEPGKNYAPSVPLKELAQRKREFSPNPLTEALQKKYQEYIQRDYAAWIEILDIGRQIANLRTGKNLIIRNVRSGRMMTISKQDGRFSDFKTVAGQFQFYSTKIISEWLSSNPELDPICPSSDDQIEEYIEAVKIMHTYYDAKFFDVQYRTVECLSAQDYGTWITRFRYDDDPKINDIVCELLDFPACRWDMRCRAEDSPYFIYQSKCSTAKLAHLLDADVASDGNNDNEYSGLRYIEMIAKQGGNTVGNDKDNPYGQYNNVEGENIVTEMWLQPEAYCDIEIPVSEKTLCGKMIPKGGLLEMFPDGMCAVGINGMKTVIGLYPENHKDHIVSGLYHAQSFSGIGKGVSDAVDATKELNDLHSQLLAHTKAHSMPAWGFNSQVVTEAQARKAAHPRGMVAIDFTNAGDGIHDINQVIQPLVPGQAAPGAFQMREFLKQDLQIAMQVTDFSNGLPGVNNRTATGAKIGDANAATILVPQHLNLADMRKRSAIVIYKLFRRFKNSPQFFATKNLNGITKGKTFDNSLFEKYVDIDFEIVANSEVPETPFAQRDATMQLLQAIGGAAGLMQGAQMNPEMMGDLANIFGVTKISFPRKNDIARVCRKRIEQAKQLLGQEQFKQKLLVAVTGQQPDNANLADSVVDHLVPPIHPKEPFHQQKVQWLAELLDDDEMLYASEELREVIGAMIDRHISVQQLATMQVQQDQNAADIMANLPMLLGQEAMNRQNQQMEQEYQQQQAQQQMQAQQQQAAQQNAMQIDQQNAQAQTQDQQSQSDHQRSLALNDQQHAQAVAQQNNQAAIADAQQKQDQDHQMRVAALGHLASLETAKQQAKNKPKPGGLVRK